MKPRRGYPVLAVILACLGWNMAGDTAAQTAPGSVQVIAQTPQGIGLFALTEAPALHLIDRLPVEFAFATFDAAAEWTLAGLGAIGVAPDGRQIALVTRRGGEAALFVYAEGAFRQQVRVSSPFLEPVWAPSSDAILLRPPYPYLPGERGEPFPDNFVYDLTTGALVAVTQTPDALEREIGWTADGARLVSRDPADGHLYSVERSGTGARALTEPGFDYPSHTFGGTLCQAVYWPAWQRWLFVEGCAQPGDQTQDQLFSVGQDPADPRLELSLPTAFPGDHVFYRRIVALHVQDAALYVSAGIGSGLGAGEGWYVMRLESAQGPEIVYERHFDEQFDLAAAVVAPEGRRIALVGDGAYGDARMVIGDLGSGETLREIGSLASARICAIRWLDAERLVYTQTDRDCVHYEPGISWTIWVYDLASDEATRLRWGTDAPAAWLLMP